MNKKLGVIIIAVALISIFIGVIIIGISQFGESKFQAKFHLTRNGEDWANTTLGIFEERDSGIVFLVGIWSTDNSGTVITQYYLPASFSYTLNILGASAFQVTPLPWTFYLDCNYSSNEDLQTLFNVSQMIRMDRKDSVCVEKDIEPKWFHTVKYSFRIDVTDNSTYITRMLTKTLD